MARAQGESICDLQGVTRRVIVDLDHLLHYFVFLNRSSAEWAENRLTILLKVLDEVVVALLMELMRFITEKLDDLLVIAHLLVAEDALAALGSAQALVDGGTELVIAAHSVE